MNTIDQDQNGDGPVNKGFLEKQGVRKAQNQAGNGQRDNGNQVEKRRTPALDTGGKCRGDIGYRHADQGSKHGDDKGIRKVSQSVQIHRLAHIFEGKCHIQGILVYKCEKNKGEDR